MQLPPFIERHKILLIIVFVLALVIIYNAEQYREGRFRLPLSNLSGGAVSFDTVSAINSGITGVLSEASQDAKGFASRSIGIAQPSPIVSPFGSGDEIDIADAKVIKNAFIDMEVESVATALGAIENIAKRLEGFVITSSAYEDNSGKKSGSITVKVPVITFDVAREDIKAVGVFIRNENTNSSDVTEEYIDIEARLINLRAQEESYRTLLNRATKIEDILKITNSLTSVRSQIESQEGRRRYLDGQTDLSTINVALSEEREVSVPSRKWRPLTIIKDAARNTIDQLQGFVDNIIQFIFWTLGIIPYLLFIAAVIWIAKRYKKN